MTRSRDVEDSHRRVNTRAAKIANEAMREEFLKGNGTDLPPAFASRLKVLRRQNLAYLQNSWSPLQPNTREGLGLKLVDADALLLMDFGEVNPVGKDMGLMSVNGENVMIHITPELSPGDKIRRIVSDAFVEAMQDKAKEFVGALLRDLLSPDSFYEAETAP